MSMVLQLLLTLPVGSSSCEAVELSFSCLRCLTTWSKGGRRVCGKGTTFTVLWTNQTLSLCLLCLPPWRQWRQCVRILICYIFGWPPKGGGHGPSGPMVNTPMTAAISEFYFQFRFWSILSMCNYSHVILHPPAKFRSNWTNIGGLLTSYRFFKVAVTESEI